jgi:protein involved in polysaccharide export with SLBB domain
MLSQRLPRFRFKLKTVLVLMLGIAIGFALNLRTLQLLTGLVANEAFTRSLPPYTIEPPDVLDLSMPNNASNSKQSISGQHLVGPDGRVNLGEFGSVYVSGKTLDEARAAIEKAVSQDGPPVDVAVDVFAYTSKAYYVVTQREGAGDSVLRIPITGNETALDAIAQIGGLKEPESAKVWIARPPLHGVGSPKILPIEWDNIAHDGSAINNYQLLPGDRVIISQKAASAATN